MSLEVNAGTFSYDKEHPVLMDITFSAQPGEVVAILGPNGAGKTTLLKCILGFLPWESGYTSLEGKKIREWKRNDLWKYISYVPQAREPAFSYRTEDMILLGRSPYLGNFSVPGKKDLEIVEQVMETAGISHLAGKNCSEISGGELQLVLIARALAAQPKLMILDEPESGLDFRNQLVVLDTVSRLAQEGMACVFNTHYPEHALQRADKSLILSKGGSCVFGPTGKVITEENIRNAFGVNAMIGEIETPESTLRNVMPLSLAGEDDSRNGGTEDAPGNARVIAAVTMIADTNDMADRINALFHEYSRLVIGRMGMPHRECGLFIIYTALDGPEEEIRELTHRLGLLPGVHVKTTQWKP